SATDAAKFSLSVNGNFVYLIDQTFISGGTIGTDITLTVLLVDDVVAATSALATQRIQLTDPVHLVAPIEITLLSDLFGDVDINFYTVVAQRGSGNYNYQLVSTNPPTFTSHLTLVAELAHAVLSLTTTLTGEYNASIVVAVDDGLGQATQTISVVVKPNNLTDGSVPGSGKLLHNGGINPDATSSNGYITSDELNLEDWTDLGKSIGEKNIGSLYGQAGVYFNGHLYLSGGKTVLNNNGVTFDDVWRSADGTNWEKIATLPIEISEHAVVVLNNKMMLFGGNGNSDVWVSIDGITWEKVGSSPTFGRSFPFAVMNNTLYAVGTDSASSSGVNLNDLWTSSDGANWTVHSNTFSNALRESGSAMVSFKGTLFLLEKGGNKVRYSSTPLGNWNVYDAPEIVSNRSSIVPAVYGERLLIAGGRYNITNDISIAGSTSGAEGTWEEINSKDFYRNTGPVFVVLSDKLTPALVPLLQASLVSVTGAATLTIATDGLSGSTTLEAGYEGVLVSISIRGGYLEDTSDYQIKLIDDAQIFQIDANRKISIALDTDVIGQTLGLTIVVDDQYAGNNASTPTLILSVEVLPRLQLDSGEDAFWHLLYDYGVTTTMTVIRDGTTPYSATLSNISATDAAKFSLSVNGGFVYLIDQTFISGGTIGTDITLTVLLVDDVVAATSAVATQRIELEYPISLVAPISITLSSGALGDADINFYTVVALGGSGNYNYQLISTEPSVFANHITLVAGATSAVLSLTTTLTGEYDNASIVVAVDDGHTQATQTISVAIYLKGLTGDHVSGIGKLLVFGGGNNKDVWAVGTSNLRKWSELTADQYPGGYNKAVYFNDSIYVTGGTGLDEFTHRGMWRSKDGVSWTKSMLPNPRLFTPALVVLNNQMLLFGGRETTNLDTVYNDSWVSTDGINWSLHAADGVPAFDNDPIYAVFNNTLYVAGGDYNGDNNDLWSTADGILWTKHNNIFANNIASPLSRSMLVFKNTLFIVEGRDETNSNTKRVYYSSNPTDSASWNSYVNTGVDSLRSAEILVYREQILILGGALGGGFTRPGDIWVSQSGLTGSWARGAAGLGHLQRIDHIAVVLGDIPTAEQIPPIKAAIVSSSITAIDISPDGLMATVTVSAGYTGVVASLTITGGYLDSGDYQVSISDDGSAFEVGADQQIRIVSPQNINGDNIEVLQLTMVVDDEHVDNPQHSPTLVLEIQVFPYNPVTIGLGDTVYWIKPEGIGNSTATLTIADGTKSYKDAMLVNLSAAEAAAVSLSVSASTLYLSDKELIKNGEVGETTTLTVFLTDFGQFNVIGEQTVQLVDRVSILPPAEITLYAGQFGDNNINFHTIVATAGLGNYSYRIVSSDLLLDSRITLIEQAPHAHLSLTTYIAEKGNAHVVVAASDGVSEFIQTINIQVKFKSLTDKSVPGSGAVIIGGGDYIAYGDLAAEHRRDVWSSHDSNLIQWQQVETNYPLYSAHQSAVYFNGYLYLMGGYYQEKHYLSDKVLRSVDGSDWEEIGQLPDGGVVDPALLVINNEIVLMGGDYGISRQKVRNAWSTVDGINWKLITENTPEVLDAYIRYQEVIYVANDHGLWSSTDVVNWTLHNVGKIDNRLSNGAKMISYAGTLFVVDVDQVQVHYSTTPTVNESWTNYDVTVVSQENLIGAEVFVYEDDILIFGGQDRKGYFGGYDTNRIIYATDTGLEGSWREFATTLDVAVARDDHWSIVLGDDLNIEQIPLIRASIVAAGEAAITVAADGLSATATVAAGYVGAVASLVIVGGYLGGGDYQISSSGDLSVVQLGENWQISIVSPQNVEGDDTQKFWLTVVINDNYANNATETKTLSVQLVVLPPSLTISIGANPIYWLTPEDAGSTATLAFAYGIAPYTVDIASADKEKFLLSLSNEVSIYLIDQDFVNSGSVGERRTVTVSVTDAASTVVLAEQVLQLINSVSLLAPTEVTLFTGPLAEASINFYTVVATGGSGNYEYELVSAGTLLSPYITLVPGGAYSTLVLTAALPRKGETEIVVAVTDGRTQISQTINVRIRFTSISDDSVAGDGALLVFGGQANGNYSENVWVNTGVLADDDWRELTSTGYPAGEFREAVFYAGDIYVLGGVDSNGILDEVWRSKDGVSWQLVGNLPDGGRREPGLAVLNNKMVLFGGRANVLYGDGANVSSIWESIDGINWQLLSSNGLPDSVDGVTYAVMDNILYVVSKADAAALRNLWSTGDGTNWTLHSNTFASEYVADAAVLNGTLFLIEHAYSSSSERMVHYSSTPAVSWNSYPLASQIPFSTDVEVVAYDDQIVYMNGGTTNPQIWVSESGLTGSWQNVGNGGGDGGWLSRFGYSAIVLGEPTTALIPLLDAKFVSATIAAAAIAQDGLSAQVTVTAGYVGAVISMTITGGFVGEGDYQISTSGDDTVLQMGADRIVSIVSPQNTQGNTVQFFYLTVVVDDQFNNNPIQSLELELAVLPYLTISSGTSTVYWVKPEGANSSTATINVFYGVAPYEAALHNLPAVLSAQFSLSLSNEVVYLTDKDFINNGTVGDQITLTVAVTDAIASVAFVEQAMQLVDQISIEAAAEISLFAGPQGEVNTNIYTIVVGGGTGAYHYQLVSTNPPLTYSHLTVVQKVTSAYLSLTAFLTTKGTSEVVVAVNDGITEAMQTIRIVATFKSVTDDSVSGVGRLLAIGGLDDSYRADTWGTDNVVLKQWVQIADGNGDNPPPLLADAAEVFYNGYIYLMGGRAYFNSQNIPTDPSNAVWRSVDGVNWQNIGTLPDGARVGAGLVVQNNKMVLMGGTDTGYLANDFRSVWSTTDGISWEKLTDSFPELDYDFAHAVFNNTIYAAGGTEIANNRHVWSSSDGATWVAISNVFSPEKTLARSSSGAVVFNGTLFIIDGRANSKVSSNRYVHYSSTPADAASWQSYSRTVGENVFGAAFIVYEGKILMMGGFRDFTFNIQNKIWASSGGVDDWELLDNDWIYRARPHAVVLNEMLNPTQVAPLSASITPAGIQEIAIAEEGLSATVTLVAGYVGAVASVEINGGYLAGDDYQISVSGDSALLQVGENRQISMLSAQNINGTSTLAFSLTIVVNDQYAGNEEQNRTIVLAAEVLPHFSLTAYVATNTMYWLTPDEAGSSKIIATLFGGIVPYTITISNLSAEYADKFSLSLNNTILHLQDKEFVNGSSVRAQMTLTLSVVDAVSSIALAERVMQLVDQVNLAPPPQITLHAGALGDANINFYTVIASDGTENYNYEILHVDALLSSYITLVTQGNVAYLSLTTFLPEKGTGEVVFAVDDGYTRATATLRVIGNFKSLTDDSVSGTGTLIVAGGVLENGSAAGDVWATNDQNVTVWSSIATTGYPNITEQAAVVFNGYIYAMGGLYNNQVWRSVTGTNWERIGHFPDGNRAKPGLVVLNNKMVLFGGRVIPNSNSGNSAWSSIDGINWQQLTANGVPEFYYDFAHAVLNNTIYAVSNLDENSRTNLWSSGDGANWTVQNNIFPGSVGGRGSQALVLNGTLFIIENIEQNDWVNNGVSPMIRYNSNPQDSGNWVSYPNTWGAYESEGSTIEERQGSKIIVYDDKIVVIGGEVAGGFSDDGNYLDIWSSRSGKEGTWEQISIAEDWVNRKYHIAIVLGEEPTSAQVSRIESSIGAAGDVVITLAADGLSATARVLAGYVGAVASVAITGGYLGGDDYQISSSGDDSVLQLGANRQISIVSAPNINSTVVQTLQLTLTIDDHYAANAADTKTLVLALEVVPSLTINLSGSAEVTVLAGPLGDANVNFYTLTAEVSGGSGNYHYQFSNSDAYLLPYITLVVDGDFVYLSLTTFLPNKGIGEVVIEVNDGLSKAAMTVSVISNFKSLTDDSVSGSGTLIVAGGVLADGSAAGDV
ncbi:MAG: hypothetical protein K0U15_02925, partial [Proteobacteria bacterium]|nr:hypothetical protein [Pseudomonadota bacterium]